MKRDGAKISLWQSDLAGYVPTNSMLPHKVFDVIIVGGGITGVTTGLLLQKAGKSCLIAEAHTLCFGTTGGTTAHLNTFLDTDYNTIKDKFGEEDAQLLHYATRQALDLVKQHVDEYNIDCGYEEKIGYVYAQTEQQVSKLNDILQSSKNAGAEVEFIDHIPVPVEYAKAIAYHRQAQIHPARYVFALAKAFEDAGGIILQNCKVDEVDADDIITVETTLGEINAKNLIYATHTPPGVNLLHFTTAPYRSYALAVKLADDKYPDGLAYDMYDPYHYYRTQDIDGEKFLIVGGEDHKTAHEENTDLCFRNLEMHTRKHFNVDKIAYQWSSQYFEPADGLASIGNLPGNPDNIFVATGFSGNGITYSHIAALTFYQMLVKGRSLYTRLFNPGRMKPAAGFANFVKENVDVVKEFVTKRIAIKKIDGFSELAAGEARLVKYDGDSLALYKDENGGIHAVSPVCPHAKCIVGWNSAEKSWDCPCHGSRFSPDGVLLTGPARHNLQKIDLTES